MFVIISYLAGIFCSFVLGWLIGARFKKEELLIIEELDRKMTHLEEVAKEKGLV